MSNTDSPVTNARRKALYAVVGCVCLEAGFTAAEKAPLETLTEMLQSFLVETARSTRGFCELAGRTEVLVGDVVMALVEMGIDCEPIPAYAKRLNRLTLPQPTLPPKTSIPKILQAGEKRPLPPHIPEYLPPFPDPHAYIRTPTHKQVDADYEAIREKAASQKRDVERALTRYMAKADPSQSLFPDDTTMFPLIPCKPIPNSYLHALMPKDQIFDEEETERGREHKQDQQHQGGGHGEQKMDSDIDIMDNPYLRPVKMPRKRKR